ncbi:LOW QUALITY PROTEIN: E3 ubiquitin-protein ligase Topors [Drosophila miranda]|uniref:LOW QUALITY PROTEIN: E3 ubiquitin-protein ligase Topors n=1 Tax=Drosophila miranda TaxID=7229 RepID=UPI00143FA6E0|nr:LOW QUALITY PROTEIN: E3 ubiquitin-protein ligase Topors [Drosophila miranda]
MAEVVEELPAAAAASYADDVDASVIVEPVTGLPLTVNGTGRTLPPAAVKFADLTESGSESGDGDGDGEGEGDGSANANSNGEPGTSASGSGRTSPPPNCAICLSRCKRKCFTDSCMHQFCFKCLCEWSKVKAECPLCKQPFKTIIHNVRPLDDFDSYPVQNSSPPIPDHHPALRFQIVRRPRFMPLVQNQSSMTNDLDGAAAGDGSQDGLPTAESSGGRHSYNRFEPYRMELMNFYRHDQDPAISGSSLSQLWRRYVYDRKLYALPVSDSLTGHFREWSARFYRNNPAQMHRLMPWIHRDIVCLLRNAAHSVSTVMQLMHDILPLTNILGPTFRRRLSPFLGERTSHFIHELFNFARSPFDMIGYDHVVQYSVRVAEEVEVDLLDMVETQSSNESDLHLEVGDGETANAESSNDWNAPNDRPSTSVIVTNPGATHSFSVTMDSDGSELPGISVRRATTSNVGSQTVAINLSMRRPASESEVIEIDDGDAAANAEVAAINDGSNTNRRQAGASIPISAHIELESSSNSSEDDECVFVLELKPPHLRTPEQVTLDSNSDSDVVFVNEENGSASATQRPSATATAVNDAEENEAQTANHGLYMGPSTSAAASRGKNWKQCYDYARRQDLLRIAGSTRPKRTSNSPRLIPQLAKAAVRAVAEAASAVALPHQWVPTSGARAATKAVKSSNSEIVLAEAKRRFRKALTRKRSAPQKLKRTTRKSSRRQVEQAPEQSPPKEEEEEEEEEKKQPAAEPEAEAESSSDGSSSDDESGGDSSEASEPKKKSSSDDSDDGSPKLNLQLSALRAALRSEAVLEDRKPLKLELHMQHEEEREQEQQPQAPHVTQGIMDQQSEETQPECSAPKRRRSCSNSNLSSHSASVASSTTASSSSALSSFNWQATSYASDPLVRGSGTTDVHDIAHSLIELSTLTHERNAEDGADVDVDVDGGVSGGLFNDQSSGVEEAISFIRHALPNTANSLEDNVHLGLYSDVDAEVSNEQSQYRMESAIDVVGAEPLVEADADTATATEDDEDDDDDDENENEDEDKDDDDDDDDTNLPMYKQNLLKCYENDDDDHEGNDNDNDNDDDDD